MQRNNRRVGAAYEQAAGKYLEREGYQILCYNYRCRFGEIDIVAQDGAYIVFCEVKYRFDRRKGSPLEAVGPRKQGKIYQCASFYLLEKGLGDCPCRFDVVGIEGNEITHIKNAFTG